MGTGVLSNGAYTSSSTWGTGAGGDTSIIADQLRIVSGGEVLANTYGMGNCGAVHISVTGALIVDGTGSTESTGIVAETDSADPGAGQGGNITIHAGSLNVLAGANVSTSTYGSGPGGAIAINVAGAMVLDETGSDQFTGVAAQTLMTGSGGGSGGDITIQAGSLDILAGAEISTLAKGSGPAGTIKITIADAMLLNGTGTDFFTGLEAETDMTDFGGGKGGDIAVQAGSLTVLGGARVSTDTWGSGSAGTISINVPGAIILDGTGTISDTGVGANTLMTDSGGGKGGDITLQAGSLNVLGGAR